MIQTKLNTSRESENKSEKKTDLQMCKYGMNIENQNENKVNHNDRLKSSDNLILSFNSKDKLNQLKENNSNNIIIEGNNNIEEKEDNNILEINNNNKINVEN